MMRTEALAIFAITPRNALYKNVSGARSEYSKMLPSDYPYGSLQATLSGVALQI
jgi:hypothetical protein